MDDETIREKIRSAIIHLSAAGVAVEASVDHAQAQIRTAEEQISDAVHGLTEKERATIEAQD